MDMKASRVVLLAVAPFCLAAVLSRTALAANTPGAWSDLWRTPDQQGQALLDAGQPAQAATRFHDPRRRAYADLEAGRQQEAARLLAPFADAQSEYNRGNALARSGQLQAALAAYDAALKQAPADRDTRHNRDLVARALRQQQQRQQQKSSQSAAQNGRQGQSGAQPQGGSRSQQSAKGSQSAGGHAAASGSQAGANRSGNGAQIANSNGSSSGSGSGSSREAPGQAERDAAQAAALARAEHRQGGKPAGQAPGADSLLTEGGGRTPKQKPETERQLALDQWLRQIPDSAAGLLQRKFLIEHMMRQQDGGDSQESGP
jgi:Ca-activated chloride channel homolog